MTDLATSFIDFDDDFDMMQFHVSDDETSAASDWPPAPSQVDWDLASRATSAVDSLPSSSGFLNCWKEGPLPDIFNLDDDVLTPVPESMGVESQDSASEEESSRPEMKRSPRSTTSRRWTDAEIRALKEAVAEYGTGNWKTIQSDPKYVSLLGDRVKSSLHRKWSRLKAKSLKEGGQLNLLPKPDSKPSFKLTSLPTSAPQDIKRVTPIEQPSRSPFHVGSWSFESAHSSINRNCMAQSLPAQSFQFQWSPMNPGERSQPPISRTTQPPMGFQPGSAPHPVHMAVCVDPAAPPPSPFVPPKQRYPSFATNPLAPSTSPSRRSSLSSQTLPKTHGLSTLPMSNPLGLGSQTLSNSHGLSQSLPKSRPVPIPNSVNSQNKARRWTSAQAQVLVQAVSAHGESRWREILNDEKYASFFAGRSPQSLVRKWNRIQTNSAKHLGASCPQTPPMSSPKQEELMDFEDNLLTDNLL